MPLTPRMLLIALLLCAVAAAALLFVRKGSPDGRTVVVYTSVDAEFALPLFEKFTKATGIAVVPRTDDEASKTTAMAERLLAMQGRPDGDVFWNSELSFTQVLASKGGLEPYTSPSAAAIPVEFRDSSGRWTGFGCRARVLIFNTEKVKRADAPKTLEELAGSKWKGRFTIAKPLFGTTRSHLVALVLALGEEKAFKLFRAWRENGVVISESNGDVRNRVADGTFDIGLTDTDDVFSAMDRKKPVDFIVPGQTAECPGVFVIPNTVAILKNAPHPAEARAFVDFLLRPETEGWLAGQGARQIPVRPLPQASSLPEELRMDKLKPVMVDAEKLASQVLPTGEKIYRVLLGEEK